MILRNLSIVVVCLLFAVVTSGSEAQAWTLKQAAFVEGQQQFVAADRPQTTGAAQPSIQTREKKISKVKPYKGIMKCKPPQDYGHAFARYEIPPQCVLPIPRPKGWELDAQLVFARNKGKVRFLRGTYGAYGWYGWWGGYGDDIDLNDDLKVPDHGVVPEFTAAYRFRPGWSLRYSIMPMVMERSGNPNRQFVFGNHLFNTGQTVKTKWERTIQQVGLVYEPVRTYRSRVGVYGGYLRLDDMLSVIDVSCCGERMDTDLNMAVAGLEFEKCLKTGRLCNTLSFQCKADVAFGDDAIGSNISTALKYSIPLNNGRWGYVKGGYRFATYKKKYSDARLMDTAMEGAVVQMGLVF